MAARPIWKDEVCIGPVHVPVKLYSAVQDTGVHFRLLHSKDLSPVTQEMVDPVSHRPVPKEELRRGIEMQPGVFVVITDEDRRALEPKASRAISVEQFVPPEQIDMRWFDRPYFLGPDSDEEGYFALSQALANHHKVGIARWVMRKKRYCGAIRTSREYLVLETLRHVEDLIPLGRISPPPGRVPRPREKALAEQLISALADRFDPAAYHREYDEHLMELIEMKARGRVVHLPKPSKRRRSTSLVDDLEASLHAGREASGGH